MENSVVHACAVSLDFYESACHVTTHRGDCPLVIRPRVLVPPRRFSSFAWIIRLRCVEERVTFDVSSDHDDFRYRPEQWVEGRRISLRRQKIRRQRNSSELSRTRLLPTPSAMYSRSSVASLRVAFQCPDPFFLLNS